MEKYDVKNPIAEVSKIINNQISSKKVLTIILDAAHGIDVPGKRSPDGKFREFVWSREIIAKLKTALINLGYVVYETNTTDKEIGLTKRKNIADSFKGKYKTLLSVHNNAAGMGDKWLTATGISYYTTRNQTVSDIFAECLYTSSEKYVFKKEIHRKDMSDKDSDFEENFTVLTGATYYAVLAEILFQDCKQDVEKLTNEAFKESVIKSLVLGFELFNSWIVNVYTK